MKDLNMVCETRQKLIDATHELVWQHSYSSVGVAELCRRAGVNKGSFYHFFESKEDLALQALEDEYQNHIPELEKTFSLDKTAMQQLDEMLEHIYEEQVEAFEKFGKVCGCPFATLGAEMAGEKQGFREKILEVMAGYDSYMARFIVKLIEEGFLPEDTDVKAKTRVFHIYFKGAMVLARITNDPSVISPKSKNEILEFLGVKIK